MGFRIYASLNTALARPKMVMAIQLATLAAKIPLNALFIFGGFGLPAFGGPGCAIATTVIAWLSLLVALMILRSVPFYKPFGLFGTGFVAPHWATLRALLKLGVPIGLSYLIEVTAFTFMALFIARLGETVVAGHQITANFGTVLYMLPVSIASATGTLVAQSIGAGKLDVARSIGFAGIRLAAVLSATIGGVVWLARDLIVHAYTPNESIVAAAVPLFLFIGFYQLFDAIQVTAAFVLRAYRVAVVPTLMYAIALWGIGLGGGYLLGLDPFGWAPEPLRGAAGFWLGNSTSLALVAAGLLWYLRVVQRRLALEQ
jgi:MATE family multidrug resistance protein